MIVNRKARFKYEALETVECGVCLVGSEVKSLRAGNASLGESFARVLGGEVWLFGCHMPPCPGADRPPDPTRPRKLLLRRQQIALLEKRLATRGLTLVPLDIHFNKQGLAKVMIGLCRGRTGPDKRRAIRERDHRRGRDED